ncbi:MAG: hypothetical protein FWG21_00140 [Oscillospiraceae bacterium]|nr:hypothetical protein [Oscillospiraceae bacterium]
MNLNAAINPRSLGDYRWSLIIPPMRQVLGNYDGFNYLGLGVLVALGISLIVMIRRISSTDSRLFKLIKKYLGIILVSIFFIIFALSNTLTAGGHIIFEYSLPKLIMSLFSQLRSSGRLFYPVYYLIFLLVCTTVVKYTKNR